MDIQTYLSRIVKYLIPSILVSVLAAIFVSWRFDNQADPGETKDTLETVFKDEIEANLYKYSIIMLGVFVLIHLLIKNLKK